MNEYNYLLLRVIHVFTIEWFVTSENGGSTASGITENFRKFTHFIDAIELRI